jgi:hypothetical protein
MKRFLLIIASIAMLWIGSYLVHFLKIDWWGYTPAVVTVIYGSVGLFVYSIIYDYKD